MAERKNRTIVEAARAMLEEKSLPKFYWAEAVRTAIVVKKTFQGRNWSTKACEPALHARARQEVRGGELGT